MMSKFIELTIHGTNVPLRMRVEIINAYCRANKDNATHVYLHVDSYAYRVKETPEEIAAMIQKAQDDHMLAEFAKHAIAIDARDSCIRADLAFDDAQAMLQEFKERTQK